MKEWKKKKKNKGRKEKKKEVTGNLSVARRGAGPA